MFQYYLLGSIVLPGILLALYAQYKVNSTYNKYAETFSNQGKTAEQIARIFLDTAGLHDVYITRTRGHLTDYYSHRKKIIALSENVYDSNSISAIGVACHEVGHALQYKSGYLPIKIRNLIIPICNFANNALWILIVLGSIFFYSSLGLTFLWIGAGIFFLSVLLNLITLPVEYNASKRAVQLLSESNVLHEEEVNCVKQVLNSAALTYVASFVVSLLNLLRLLLLIMSRRRKD